MAPYRDIDEKHGHRTDEELMADLQGNDREAHSVLYVRHSERLRKWALRRGVPPGDVEDPVQETFLRIFKERARFDASRSFAPWVNRVFYRCLLDYFRRIRHLPESAGHLIEGFYNDQTQSLLDGLYLNGCADRLDEEDWELYVEWKTEGRTLRDLSESTSIPVSSLHRSLQRTEQILRDCLESTGGTNKAVPHEHE
jgi:RNA polymerase sigma-70 factor (ECF subfamily)